MVSMPTGTLVVLFGLPVLILLAALWLSRRERGS